MNATLNPVGFPNFADIAHRPTRIQDVPKDVLDMYGIFFSDEISYSASVMPVEDYGSDTDEENLVIDEDRPSPPPETPTLTIRIAPTTRAVHPASKMPPRQADFAQSRYQKKRKADGSFAGRINNSEPVKDSFKSTPNDCSAQILLTPKLEEGETFAYPLDLSSLSCASVPNANNQNNNEKLNIKQSQLTMDARGPCPVCKKKIDESHSGLHLLRHYIIDGCYICRTFVDEKFEEHMAKHCPQWGCRDLLTTEAEFLLHAKIHRHPSKPFRCRFCTRRYRTYTKVKQHELSTFCKARPLSLQRAKK